MEFRLVVAPATAVHVLTTRYEPEAALSRPVMAAPAADAGLAMRANEPALAVTRAIFETMRM